MRRRSRRWWIVLAAGARDRSGSVLAITALMMLALMGFVALAVDVGSWYTTQTRMQTAADAAALAAAMELADPGYAENDVVAAAEDGATWNGFDPADGASVAVTIAPDGESVEVVITETSTAAFAGLFLEDPVSIQARAVGGLKAGAPICLLALDSDASSALYLDSNAQLNAPDCAVHVNSASSSGLATQSNSGMTAAEICVTGDHHDTTTGTVSPEPQIGCPPKADPLASLAPPADSGCAAHPAREVYDDDDITLYPGVYCGGLEIKNNSNVTFDPGIYIIKAGRSSSTPIRPSRATR